MDGRWEAEVGVVGGVLEAGGMLIDTWRCDFVRSESAKEELASISASQETARRRALERAQSINGGRLIAQVGVIARVVLLPSQSARL